MIYLRWLDEEFYQYLFRKADNPNFCGWWERLKCRINYHPCGCVFYNPGGYEPDERCQDCGDNI